MMRLEEKLTFSAKYKINKVSVPEIPSQENFPEEMGTHCYAVRI